MARVEDIPENVDVCLRFCGTCFNLPRDYRGNAFLCQRKKQRAESEERMQLSSVRDTKEVWMHGYILLYRGALRAIGIRIGRMQKENNHSEYSEILTE
jgi:hypothetical protein